MLFKLDIIKKCSINILKVFRLVIMVLINIIAQFYLTFKIDFSDLMKNCKENINQVLPF